MTLDDGSVVREIVDFEAVIPLRASVCPCILVWAALVELSPTKSLMSSECFLMISERACSTGSRIDSGIFVLFRELMIDFAPFRPVLQHSDELATFEELVCLGGSTEEA